MSIIKQRLNEYNINTLEQQENALKEIAQEIILYGLSVSGLFEEAMFQGGTALRILYKLPRFSEDMDFMLKMPNHNFTWEKYTSSIYEICAEYGIITTISDKSKSNNAIRRLFIKNESLGGVLNLDFKNHINKNILIKLEIDVNPPQGSNCELKYLNFPLDHSIVIQDLQSSFANKSHALLCRNYVKGRDWYDFLWYISRKVNINFTLLANAIKQFGPWKGQEIIINSKWYLEQIANKINSIDWSMAKQDVERFLNKKERMQLKLWNADFFEHKLLKLKYTLTNY